jgi:hypothetical protein
MEHPNEAEPDAEPEIDEGPKPVARPDQLGFAF